MKPCCKRVCDNLRGYEDGRCFGVDRLTKRDESTDKAPLSRRMMTKQPESKKKVRVLIVAPSFDILGGQSVQAARLLNRLSEELSLEVGFLPINPRLPGILRQLQRMSTAYGVLNRLLAAAVLFIVRHHSFFSVYFSSSLRHSRHLIGKLYVRKVLLNITSRGRGHLQRWRRPHPTISSSTP